MKNDIVEIKRALISVSDKTNLIEFARGLTALDIEIISTGGTSQLLRDAHIAVRDVADVTQFPEMMNGRVKTLHPKVHGGILGKRDAHQAIATEHAIEWIDLVVVNLYPFANTIKNPATPFAEAIENIDIGGPALIRSAGKNMDWVSVVVDPEDYDFILQVLREQRGLDFATRKKMAIKAFAHTARYDSLIHHYLADAAFTDQMQMNVEKCSDLRYGENPHQPASAYQFIPNGIGVLSAKQHQGKQLSYNNIVDADAAIACVREFTQPACVIVKHATPCGVAEASTINDAFVRAWNADSQSAFGGIIALNRPCTQDIAELLAKIFVEVIIAPAYDVDALEVLATKQAIRVLEYDLVANKEASHELKFIAGGLLVQEKNRAIIHDCDLTVVTKVQPTEDMIQSLLFAWRVVKHIKSNAILIAKDSVTLGVGAGQVSRVDAVDIALRKAGNALANGVLASDAFFPFRDSIDHLANKGIYAIIQPGGSIRDEEVIAACDEQGMAMVFTGKRCFKH